MKQTILLQVREMLDRDWSLLEIAAKCNLSPDVVRMAIDIIEELLT
jgi:hypothetical protein